MFFRHFLQSLLSLFIIFSVSFGIFSTQANNRMPHYRLDIWDGHRWSEDTSWKLADNGAQIKPHIHTNSDTDLLSKAIFQQNVANNEISRLQEEMRKPPTIPIIHKDAQQSRERKLVMPLISNGMHHNAFGMAGVNIPLGNYFEGHVYYNPQFAGVWGVSHSILAGVSYDF